MTNQELSSARQDLGTPLYVVRAYLNRVSLYLPMIIRTRCRSTYYDHTYQVRRSTYYDRAQARCHPTYYDHANQVPLYLQCYTYQVSIDLL